jgi:hypothetical protein
VVAIVLAVAACANRDVETTPFRIDASRSDGVSFVVDVPAFYRFEGTARLLDPTVLLVQGASLPDTPPFDVTLRFRSDAPGGVVFPPQLDGSAVTVVLVSDRPASTRRASRSVTLGSASRPAPRPTSATSSRWSTPPTRAPARTSSPSVRWTRPTTCPSSA